MAPRPARQALTSAARTAWSRRLSRAAQSLRDLLEMRARERGRSAPQAEGSDAPPSRPPQGSPAPGAPGRSRSGPPAPRAASPARGPGTPAGPRPPAPGSAHPPSAHGTRPAPAPLRAEARLRRAQARPPAPARVRPRVGESGWWWRFLLPFPHGCVEDPPQAFRTYPSLPGRPPEPGREDCDPAGGGVLGWVGWDELRD